MQNVKEFIESKIFKPYFGFVLSYPDFQELSKHDDLDGWRSRRGIAKGDFLMELLLGVLAEDYGEKWVSFGVFP